MLEQATFNSPYIALLYQNPQRLAEPFTVDGSGWLTLSGGSPLLEVAEGKRVSLITSATLPGQSQYFMLPHPSNNSKFKICLTAADAIASTPIAVASSATGTVFDEAIEATDTLASLVSYEMNFAGYQRRFSPLLATVQTVPPTQPKASKQGNQASFTNASSATLECTHVLAMFNGNSSPGNAFADFYGLTANTGVTTVPANAQYNVNVAIEAVNG